MHMVSVSGQYALFWYVFWLEDKIVSLLTLFWLLVETLDIGYGRGVQI